MPPWRLVGETWQDDFPVEKCFPWRRMGNPERNAENFFSSFRREAGEASIEFVGIVLGLLIPLVYLVLVFFQVQAGLYAAEMAAASSARILTDHPHTGARAAQLAVELAASDQGLPVNGVRYVLTCDTANCPQPGSSGSIKVSVKVPLPVVGSLVQGMFPTDISLSSVHPIKWGMHGA